MGKPFILGSEVEMWKSQKKPFVFQKSEKAKKWKKKKAKMRKQTIKWTRCQKSQKENKSVEDLQEEQEKEIEEAKKSEAQKTAEAKEKAMEEKIATVTAPVSTMEADDPARRRQEETMVSISSPSKKRSRSKGRRSLITGKSGGGIGYYSRFFTQDKT